MGQMFILLLRILFPLDKVARSREFMRGWIKLVMNWVRDPEDVEGFAYWSDDRARLEGHIAAVEYGLQILIWERARDMLGLPFLFIPRQHNPHIRHPKSMSQLFRRLTQIAHNFHNLDALAARRARAMQRETDLNPLHLVAAYQASSPALRAVEATYRRLASTRAQHWERWIALTCAQDGRGACAFARGPPPPSHPATQTPHLAASCENAPARPQHPEISVTYRPRRCAPQKTGLRPRA